MLQQNKPVPENFQSANSGKPKGGKYKFIWPIIFAVVAVLAAVYYFFSLTEKQITLTVGAGPYNTDSYELMVEVADVISRHSDGLRLKVIGTKDSSENISLLNSAKIDLATIRSDTPVVKDVRMIATLFPDYFQLIARDNTAINSIFDLKGKRIGLPQFGKDEFRSFWVIADHYNIPINSMKWSTHPFEKAADLMLNGELDAVFTVRSLRDRKLINLFADAELKSVPLKFIEINQAEALAIKRPFLGVGEVPRGAFSGSPTTPSRDVTTATTQRIVVTSNNIDADAIREFTKILFEHRLDLTIRFALASALQQPKFGEGQGIPLHEGAQSYFDRDQPSFIQENAEPLALLVTLLAMLVSLLFAIRSRVVANQKDRMDSYNYLLLDIANKTPITHSIEEIKALKSEMYAILETVVRALDTDEVTEEGFQSFAFLWESVQKILGERNQEIEQSESLMMKAIK